MRLHLRPLGVGQNEAIHPQLESHQAPAVNPKSQQTLARRREPPPPDEITASSALTLAHAPVADCARYDLLRGRHAAA
jgi:hypothetical protein